MVTGYYGHNIDRSQMKNNNWKLSQKAKVLKTVCRPRGRINFYRMGSHSGRSFLNSCIKVPIDPCNNCPAPVYNRPKMYLGRLSMTPTTALATTTVLTTKTCDTETDTKWSCSGIRSLAKFYDSIPGS